MATDDERREVARRLRMLDVDGIEHGYELLEEVADCIGDEGVKYGAYERFAVLLADLIEPSEPSCAGARTSSGTRRIERSADMPRMELEDERGRYEAVIPEEPDTRKLRILRDWLDLGIRDYEPTSDRYDECENYPAVVSDNDKHNAACAIKACPFAKHEDGMSWIPGARIFTGASIPGRNDRVQFALVTREKNLFNLNLLSELGATCDGRDS